MLKKAFGLTLIFLGGCGLLAAIPKALIVLIALASKKVAVNSLARVIGNFVALIIVVLLFGWILKIGVKLVKTQRSETTTPA